MEIDLGVLLETFQAETEENLAAMEEALVVLEDRPDDLETLQGIFRAAHTLKGNAAALRFPGLAEFAHGVEDLLERLRQRSVAPTRDLITDLLRAVDAIRELVPAAIAGEHELSPASRKLLKRLAKQGGGRPRRRAADDPTVTKPESRPRPPHDTGTWAQHSRTLRVAVDKLDRMLTLTGEIAIARGRITQTIERGGVHVLEAVREAYRDTDRLHADLQELVMQVRMVPLGPTFRQHIRTVRDLAAAYGKQARLVIEGADVEVDTAVIEQIRDPLTHMVRNALDHGIEAPEARRAAGKDPCGNLSLRAYHEAGSVVIELTDDGAGLDRERIEERARALGLLAAPEKLGDGELFQLIFAPGFSTVEAVTELSGRGVGMDVVRRSVEALRGSASLDSRRGRGTSITIRLPLTLAIIDGFAVEVGRETFVLPLDAIVECVELPATARDPDQGHGVFSLRGTPLPWVRLRRLFRVNGAAPERESVVIVQRGDQKAGLVVDALQGQMQTVIKPLGQLFSDLRAVSGCTILGTGQVALILDVTAVLQELVERSTTHGGAAPGTEHVAELLAATGGVAQRAEPSGA